MYLLLVPLCFKTEIAGTTIALTCPIFKFTFVNIPGRNNSFSLSTINSTLKDLELELITVETMQQRKAKMAELADGFITLPGGIGSMEEIFEVLTAAQLGFHGKPIGLLNVDGYYDYLIKFMDHMIHEEFLIPAHGSLIIHDTDPKNLLEKMRKFEPPKVGKWIEKIIEKNKLADETSN